MTANSTPEIGQRVQLGDVTVNYHDIGQGDPVMLIHGSGPGVSSWVNWGKVAPILSQKFRLIMPDMIGFGYTEAPESRFDLDAWANVTASDLIVVEDPESGEVHIFDIPD